MKRVSPKIAAVLALLVGIAFVISYSGAGAQAQGGAPSYVFDPSWPKPLPMKWKIGGITGLAVDRNDDVWVLNRPNDLTSIELHAEHNPPIADCCVRPPSMIHISKTGEVIDSFDAPQGHGMDVDSKGFVYIGQETVRKYDGKSGKLVGEIARVPETEGGGGGGGRGQAARTPGQGSAGPVAGFITVPGGGGRGAPNPEVQAKQAAQRAAFRKKYPPDTPMIVGGLEEIRIDEGANEIYAADNYLGGRVLVFDLNTLAFKRGWGAYGKPLSQISTDDATRDYKPGGPMAKDFVGHLTLNFSNDGLVYAADRVGNRIHVTDKQGKFVKEFPLAVNTGVGGAPGGVGFSPDKEQRYLFISDLTNNHIWFLNRADGKIVGQLGSMGDNGGQFYGLHMIAVDSTGNIYTGEVFAGERVQRFVPANSARGKLLSQLATMK
jgi:DNA-binding beta-propeller fold protein YncE